jgi:hypothetical protein
LFVSFGRWQKFGTYYRGEKRIQRLNAKVCKTVALDTSDLGLVFHVQTKNARMAIKEGQFLPMATFAGSGVYYLWAKCPIIDCNTRY